MKTVGLSGVLTVSIPMAVTIALRLDVVSYDGQVNLVLQDPRKCEALPSGHASVCALMYKKVHAAIGA